MRLAMMTGKKYVALVNNYSNFIETGAYLEKIASINLLKYLEMYHDKQKTELDQSFPKNLSIFTFDNEDIRDFSSPKSDSIGLMNYYCMDGASLLPIFALDIKKGDKILDLCSSPGGKALAMLQTLLPGNIIKKYRNRLKQNNKKEVWNAVILTKDVWIGSHECLKVIFPKKSY